MLVKYPLDSHHKKVENQEVLEGVVEDLDLVKEEVAVAEEPDCASTRKRWVPLALPAMFVAAASPPGPGAACRH